MASTGNVEIPTPTRAEMVGDRLYGDDFTADQIERWFADEADAYIDMTGEGVDECGYLEWARRYGYARLPDRRWPHVLAFGAARGAEIAPIAHLADKVTLLEASEGYTPVPEIADRTSLLLAQSSGDIALPDDSVDLIVCFGVLHHIPNVTHVLSEFARVAAPGGWSVIREPIHSMGEDWTRPRPGLTPHERGIPRAMLRGMVTEAGFTVRSEQLMGFPPISRIWRYWKAPYNNPFLTRLDAAICRALAWNDRYLATTKWQKLRPTSVSLVLQA